MNLSLATISGATNTFWTLVEQPQRSRYICCRVFLADPANRVIRMIRTGGNQPAKGGSGGKSSALDPAVHLENVWSAQIRCRASSVPTQGQEEDGRDFLSQVRPTYLL